MEQKLEATQSLVLANLASSYVTTGPRQIILPICREKATIYHSSQRITYCENEMREYAIYSEIL